MGNKPEDTLRELQEEVEQAQLIAIELEENIEALTHAMNVVEDKKRLYDLQIQTASETSVQLDKVVRNVLRDAFMNGGQIRKIIGREKNNNEQ